MADRAKASKIEWGMNNFDLLRLFAALQVVLAHCAVLLHVTYPFVSPMFGFFPGVPIFFFISGFLISAAWERNPNLGAFARNRILRIFPAYWAAFLFSFLAIVLLHRPHWRQLLLWSAAQLVMLSDWNPQWLRSYGVGVANGALWTIPIELCFYAATPLLYWLFRKTRYPDVVLGVVMALAFVVAAVDFELVRGVPGATMLFKFIALTPIPWIGMFAFGMLAQRYRHRVIWLVRGRFWFWLGLYALISLLTRIHTQMPLLGVHSRYIGAANFLCLGGLILSAAFSRPDLAQRLLRRNDFSYGIYLFHMPVMNIVVMLGLTGYPAVAMTMAGAALLAGCSWFLIEKPCLRAKIRPLYRHESIEP